MDKAENAGSEAVVETRELTIAGMGCENCVRKLERALRAQDGVPDDPDRNIPQRGEASAKREAETEISGAEKSFGRGRS